MSVVDWFSLTIRRPKHKQEWLTDLHRLPNFLSQKNDFSKSLKVNQLKNKPLKVSYQLFAMFLFFNLLSSFII